MAAGLLDAPWLLAPALVVIVFASVVQFGLGLGFGLVAAPLLALLDPRLVPAPTLWLGLATATLAAVRERGAIVWGEVLTGVPGRAAGVGLAALLLAALPDRQSFALVFGGLVGLAVALSAAGLSMPFTRAGLLAMSVVSGLMGTITSVGAPPLAILYQGRPAATARPTLSAFFAIGCALSLGGLWAAGWTGWRDLALAALLAPGMLAGLWLSRRLAGRLDRRFRPALLGLAGAAAVLLVARGLA